MNQGSHLMAVLAMLGIENSTLRNVRHQSAVERDHAGLITAAKAKRERKLARNRRIMELTP